MWLIIFASSVILITIWLLWRKNHFSLFKQLDIPGPDPSIFFGNYKELVKQNPLVAVEKWQKQYGKVFGYYYGWYPVLIVSDLDMLKKVQISSFQKFINRARIFHVGRKEKNPGDGCSTSLTNLRDKHWKEVRGIITPAFTTSKLKLMSPLIDDAINSLMERIEEKSNKDQSFNIADFYKALTMDVIARTAFGIQTDCQRNPKDPFLLASKMIFATNLKEWLYILGFSFPEFGALYDIYFTIFFLFTDVGSHPRYDLIRRLKAVIKMRRELATHQRQDVLQLLLNAKSVSDFNNATAQALTAGGDGNETSNSDHLGIEKDQTKLSSIRKLSEGEIIDNSVVFLLAGYETTSTTLSFVTHFLVNFPEVQERVRKEVNRLFEHEGNLDYASVQQLQYLDQVMNESLRFYPPIYFFVTREAGEDMEIEGYKIRKGVAVQVPVYSIHRDSENWKNPEVFDPERFSSENKHKNHHMAFQAFGAGPRNCVGMRLAQMEVKMTIARILQKYRLVACDETDPHPIDLAITILTASPKQGVTIKAEML